MHQTECTRQLEVFEVGRQQVTMTFDGGNVVTVYVGPEAEVFAVVRDPEGIAIESRISRPQVFLAKHKD
jgi:hypothetical protein